MKHGRKPRGGAAPEGAEIASATECTGLLAALPPDDAQAESLTELSGVHSARDPRRGAKDTKEQGR